MKNIIEKIGELDKETAKDLRLVIEMSYDCIRGVIEDTAEQERLLEIVDAISEAAQERVKALSLEEIENG